MTEKNLQTVYYIVNYGNTHINMSKAKVDVIT